MTRLIVQLVLLLYVSRELKCESYPTGVPFPTAFWEPMNLQPRQAVGEQQAQTTTQSFPPNTQLGQLQPWQQNPQFQNPQFQNPQFQNPQFPNSQFQQLPPNTMSTQQFPGGTMPSGTNQPFGTQQFQQGQNPQQPFQTPQQNAGFSNTGMQFPPTGTMPQPIQGQDFLQRPNVNQFAGQPSGTATQFANQQGQQPPLGMQNTFSGPNGGMGPGQMGMTGMQTTGNPLGTQQGAAGMQQTNPPLGMQQTNPPLGMQQTNPPLGAQQSAMGMQQTNPPLGMQQTNPPLGMQQTNPSLGAQQSAMGMQQTNPPLGMQQTNQPLGTQSATGIQSPLSGQTSTGLALDGTGLQFSSPEAQVAASYIMKQLASLLNDPTTRDAFVNMMSDFRNIVANPEAYRVMQTYNMQIQDRLNNHQAYPNINNNMGPLQQQQQQPVDTSGFGTNTMTSITGPGGAYNRYQQKEPEQDLASIITGAATSLGDLIKYKGRILTNLIRDSTQLKSNAVNQLLGDTPGVGPIARMGTGLLQQAVGQLDRTVSPLLSLSGSSGGGVGGAAGQTTMTTNSPIQGVTSAVNRMTSNVADTVSSFPNAINQMTGGVTDTLGSLLNMGGGSMQVPASTTPNSNNYQQTTTMATSGNYPPGYTEFNRQNKRR